MNEITNILIVGPSETAYDKRKFDATSRFLNEIVKTKLKA